MKIPPGGSLSGPSAIPLGVGVNRALKKRGIAPLCAPDGVLTR
ncbi:hypothetical protein HMPREF9080_00490 [Cardiobacterium valvarum F0432]|uniref:Uncharacterized protein n=1 Tax=Cardiobacterium valvarum F0432 TaxID=797473 RepID=G9ZCL4_9GAMM|nr:hypothetical protein HMPREF9080_00490 [Cardiobacterium valvarum F0432]